MKRTLLFTTALLASGCLDLDTSLDEGLPTANESESMYATISVDGGIEVPFVAEEVVASLTTLSGREEVVVSGLSADRSRSLSFVLDAGALHYGESADLAEHAALFMESGLLGEDLLFDGTPQGELYWDGELESGRDFTASFNMNIPVYDRDGNDSDYSVSIEGQFTVHLMED